MFNQYLTLFWTHLNWVFEFLLYYPFYKLHDSQLPIIGEEVSNSICHYEYSTIPADSVEDADCAVCLCKMEEGGEEIRVLRCDHAFHKDCLDRWLGFMNAICPLCRQSVSLRRNVSELGAEVLFFQFCSVRNEHRDTWWLR